MVVKRITEEIVGAAEDIKEVVKIMKCLQKWEIWEKNLEIVQVNFVKE